MAAQVWLIGSLNGRRWDHVRPVALAVAVLLPIAFSLGRRLSMMEIVPGDEAAESAADEAVRVLLADLEVFRFHSGHSDLKTSRSTGEAVVARVSLLVQAYAGMAGLIREGKECGSVSGALQRRPPVTRTTRVATVDTAVAARGATVVLDLASAGLPFGGEPRVCPGRDHALAIAAGAVHGDEDGE